VRLACAVRSGWRPQPRHLPELERVTAGAPQPGSLSPASSRLPGPCRPGDRGTAPSAGL